MQYPEIMRHSYVEKSFLDFQIVSRLSMIIYRTILIIQESYRATSIFVSVDVYLADGEKHVIKCNVSDNTSHILKVGLHSFSNAIICINYNYTIAFTFLMQMSTKLHHNETGQILFVPSF